MTERVVDFYFFILKDLVLMGGSEMENQRREVNSDSTIENNRLLLNRIVIIAFLIIALFLVVSLNCSFSDNRMGNYITRTALSLQQTELALKKTVDFYIPTKEQLTYFPPTQTALRKTQALQFTQLAHAEQTNEVIGSTVHAYETEIKKSNEDYWATQEEKNRIITLTANAEATAEANKPKPPVINSIDIPSQIQADGNPTPVMIYFSDPNGDVEFYECKQVSGEWNCSKKRIPEIYQGTSQNGVFQINLNCGFLPGDVRLQFILTDKKGLKSVPYEVSFSCR
jgi:hypothetical protein